MRHRRRAPRRRDPLDQARPRGRAEPRAHLPEGRRAQGPARGSRPAAPAGATHRDRLGADRAGPQAFDEIERRIGAMRARHGHDAVAIYAGNPTVHNLGAMLGIGDFIRAVRTPQPVFRDQRGPAAAHGGVARDVRPPVPDAGAGRGPHAAVRLHRRQSGRVRRLDHGRAGLREARRGAARARRAVHRRSTRGAPSRRRSPTSTCRCAPAPTCSCCSALLHEVFAAGAPTSGISQRSVVGLEALREAVLALRPRAARRAHRHSARAHRRGSRSEIVRRAARAGLRPRRRLHAGVRRAGAVADLLPERGDRPPRQRGRHDVRRAGRGPDARLRLEGPLRQVPLARARAAGVRQRAAGRGARRGDPDRGRGPRSRAAHVRRQPGALDAERPAARSRRSRASTSWSRWTCT